MSKSRIGCKAEEAPENVSGGSKRPMATNEAVGIKAWFVALSTQDRQVFLAISGTNLTTFARQATKIEEHGGLNEMHHRIYQAIAAIGAGRPNFNADELWETLNSFAKTYRLDMALQQAFSMAKQLIETR